MLELISNQNGWVDRYLTHTLKALIEIYKLDTFCSKNWTLYIFSCECQNNIGDIKLILVLGSRCNYW